jgi:hypothetical protein
MNLSKQDMVIVEQALQQAIQQETDYQVISTYQEVLDKIQEADRKQTAAIRALDGFRYDYDDTSDLQ